MTYDWFRNYKYLINLFVYYIVYIYLYKIHSLIFSGNIFRGFDTPVELTYKAYININTLFSGFNAL